LVISLFSYNDPVNGCNIKINRFNKLKTSHFYKHLLLVSHICTVTWISILLQLLLFHINMNMIMSII